MSVKRLTALVAVCGLVALGGCTSETKESEPSDTATASGTVPSGVQTTADPNGSPTPDITQPEPETTPNTGATESVPRETKTNQPVDKDAEFGTGVKAKIVSKKAIEMKNVLPGEIAGPAVAITVEYTNGTDKPVSLANTIVSLNYSGQEASSFSGEPAKNPPESLAPGKKATGVYVFGVPKDGRKNVLIRVAYAPTAPVVEFKGPIG